MGCLRIIKINTKRLISIPIQIKIQEELDSEKMIDKK